MLLRAYSIFDNKALVFHAPFFAINNAAASRSFGDLVADPQTNVGRHPGDFVLFCVGHYDDAKGTLMPVSPLEHVVDAAALVQLTRPVGDLFSKLDTREEV